MNKSARFNAFTDSNDFNERRGARRCTAIGEPAQPDFARVTATPRLGSFSPNLEAYRHDHFDFGSAHFRDQHMPIELPAVLGHEGAGVVERSGAR